jgi:hypothetical protein
MADVSINPLYPVIGTIAAAAITAIYSTWRLIGEKETKVSEFRKSWVETFRSKISDFAAAGHIITGRISIITTDSKSNKSDESSNKAQIGGLQKRIIEIVAPELEIDNKIQKPLYDRELQSELLPHWAELRIAYNSIILHLNPSEQFVLTTVEQFNERPLIKKDEPAYQANLDGKSKEEIDKENKAIEAKQDAQEKQYEKYLESILDIAKKISDDDQHEKPIPFFKRIFQKKQKLNKAPENNTTNINENGDSNQKSLDNSSIKLTKEQTENLAIIQTGNPKAAEALLLSMFATKKLLEAKQYATVYRRRQAIEFGITIIDSSGSKVIKKVWEEIKNGETRYNLITTLSLWVAPPILFITLVLFFMFSLYPDDESLIMKESQATQRCNSFFLSKPIFQASIKYPVVDWPNPQSLPCSQIK